MLNPQAAQPLLSLFNLSIGSLSSIYSGTDAEGNRNPASALDFEYRMTEHSSLMTMTLFDASGMDIEPYIWESQQTNPSNMAGGTFQFGWAGSENVLSESINFDVANTSVQAMDNYFALTLTGTPSLSPYVSSNQINGTIDQILQRFSDLHSINVVRSHKLGIQYTLDMCVTANDDTGLREMRFCKIAQESDLQFVRRVVEQYYLDAAGIGGFTVYLGSENGQPTLYIMRPSDNPATITYKCQGPDSPVIRWNPSINNSNVIFDGNDCFYNGFHSITGNTMTLAGQVNATKAGQAPQVNQAQNPASQFVTSTPPTGQAPSFVNISAENMDASLRGAGVRYRPMASCTSYAGVNPAYNNILRMQRMNNNAQLVVIGDPTLMINSQTTGLPIINVEYCYPQNYNTKVPPGTLHYTSGDYYLTAVTHSIKNGLYLTTLDLERASTPDPPQVQNNV